MLEQLRTVAHLEDQGQKKSPCACEPGSVQRTPAEEETLQHLEKRCAIYSAFLKGH